MSHRHSRTLWVIPIAVGAGLRLIHLTSQSLWVDEILTLKAASLGSPFQWSAVFANPQGPLLDLWLRLWVSVAGDSDLALRLWAVVGGVLGLGAAAAALRRWAGDAGLWGMWVLALSPFHLWYSQEVRNYIYMMAFAWMVLWAVEGVRRRPGPGSAVLLALVLAATLLCNLSGAFLVPVLLLGVLVFRVRGGWWIVAASLVALGAASPWIRVEFAGHMDLSRLAGEAPVIRGGNTFLPAMVPYTAAVFLGGFGIAPALRTLHTGVSTAEWLRCAPGLTALALASAWLFGMSLRRGPRRDVGFLVLWAVLPILLAATVGILGFKAYNPRYVSVVLPAWVLLLSLGAAEGWRRRRVPTGVALGLLAASMVWGGVRQTVDSAYHKEAFREVAAYVQQVEQAGDLVLLEGVSRPFERYYRGRSRVESWYPNWVDPAKREAFDALVAGHPRVIWVGSRLWYVDPEGLVLDWLRRSRRETGTHRETGVLVRILERTSP